MTNLKTNYLYESFKISLLFYKAKRIAVLLFDKIILLLSFENLNIENSPFN